MKVILMAAGIGSRISRNIGGNPKCTVKVDKNLSLIERTISILNENGIKDISIVLGYKGEIIKNILKDKKVKYYYNPFYNVTNSIASLWFAKEELTSEKDIVLMNADVFFEASVVDFIKNLNKEIVLIADERRKEEADYKLKYSNSILEKYGKDLEGADITGEYVGIAKISKNQINNIKEKLLFLIDNQKHDLWWENVLYNLSHEQNIFVENIGEKFWAEVDYIEDYERILEYVKNEN